MEEEEMRICENCGQKFAANIIDLHEAYCRRNIRKCKLCHKMVDLNDEQAHNNQFHAQQPCPHCRTPLEPPLLPAHIPTCPQRPLDCQYCQNPFPAASLPRHEQECGSRTRQCEKCRKYVMINVQKQHSARCNGLQLRRNQSQEERRLQQNRIYRQRMNSNDNIKKESVAGSSPRQLLPKRPVDRVVVQREPITQLVDPVPISVRLALQRERERRQK